jgi:hypothetical protein
VREIQSPRELRGVPIVGVRAKSAIQGSDPVEALERRRRAPLPPPEPLPPREILSAHYERVGPPVVTRATREAGRFFR